MPLEKQEQLTAWQVAPLGDLIRHLVGSRHQECRDDLGGLETMLALITMEPGPSHLALVKISHLMSQLCTELRAHLVREERDLFPVLLAMEQGGTPRIEQEHLGLMKSLLEEEHGHEGGLLRDIQVLTAALATDQPTNSPQARLQTALSEFSARLQEHMELEEQALFPRIEATPS